jgi:YVTN family beta-propeller protein
VRVLAASFGRIAVRAPSSLTMTTPFARACTLSLALLALAATTPALAAPFAYVTRGFDPPNEVARVDVATGAAAGAIPIGESALGLAVSPDAQRAYVAGITDVKIIDTATNTVVGAIPIAGVGSVALSPSGSRLYLTSQDTDQLFVVDTATNEVVTPVPTGDLPRPVVVNAAGTRAYVGNTGNPESVTVVDLATNAVVTTIPSGGFLDRPENLGITPDGSRLYAANFGQGAGGTTVSVIDTASNTITKNISVGKSPITTVADPSGEHVYVGARDDSRLDIIDVASATAETPVPLPFAPVGIAIAPQGDRLVLSGEDKVGVFDLATKTFAASPIDLTGAAGSAIPPLQSPVARIAAVAAVAGQPSAFDGSGSSATQGAISAYDWLFGDGAAASGPAVTHTYAVPGTYDVSLTVTNDCAATAVFGPLGVAGGGSTAFCNGPRSTSSTTRLTVAAPAVAAKGGSVVRLRRKPSVRRLRSGALKVDTGIDVACGAVVTGCGGSQRSTATVPRSVAHSRRLLLAATKLPARAGRTVKVIFTVPPRVVRRLAGHRRSRVTTTVRTHDADGKRVTTTRRYRL